MLNLFPPKIFIPFWWNFNRYYAIEIHFADECDKNKIPKKQKPGIAPGFCFFGDCDFRSFRRGS